MGHYETLRTQNFGMDSDLYLALKAKLMHKKSTEEVTIIGIPPITIISNGNNATVGLKGNTVQSGTPSDSPVMPQGTGERMGNLFDESNFALVQVTSTAYRYGTSLGVLPQGAYTFNATKSASAQSIYLTARLNGTYSQTTISSVPFTFTADGASEYIVRTASNTGTTWEAEKYSNIMLNLGSTALPYEPYGYKIPISSANTTTTVYLGEVESTRRIKKLVLTGEESGWQLYQQSSPYWQYEVYQFWLDNIIDSIQYSSLYSTIAPFGVTSMNRQNYEYGCYAVSSGKGIAFQMVGAKGTFVNVNAWETYLQQQYANGTPVTIWYVLSAATTGIVNEPLMKIGDYADEISGIIIPTIKGTNIVDVDTEVKPSEISITYTKGKEININSISDMEKLTIADLEKMTIAELEG